MFTNDTPRPPENCVHTYIVAYADDETILVSGRAPEEIALHAQRILDEKTDYEDKWLIATNPQKTQMTLYGARDHFMHNLQIYSHTPNMIHQNPTRLAYTQCTKILGVTFDKSLRFNLHQNIIQARASRTNASLGRFYPASKKLKLHLYKALVRPILTYAPLSLVAWSDTWKRKAQRIQNSALKRACRSPLYSRMDALHNNNKLTPLNTYAHTRLTKQLGKLTTDPLYTSLHVRRYAMAPRYPAAHEHLPPVPFFA